MTETPEIPTSDAPPMRLNDFDYDLPEALIALRPAEPRGSARLLHVGQDQFDQDRLDDLFVADLPALLRPGDLLVVNDTKVIPARLFGLRRREDASAKIEATLIERRDAETWIALAKPGKRLKPGDRIDFAPSPASAAAASANPQTLSARVVEKLPDGGRLSLEFDRSGAALDAAVAALGAPPLPPYIAARREADARDRADYQTVFANRPGAVAAPTASLHFDADLLARLDAVGVDRATVTLHVGAGTFSPVTAENPLDHKMHAEWGEIDEQAANKIGAARARGGRVVAVGTTAMRVLETAMRSGAPHRSREGFPTWRGSTDLFITPGFSFRVVDALLTNFHLPRSTLLMLVAAFVGRERILRAYEHAVAARYRFFSYGDATFLERLSASEPSRSGCS